MAAPGAFEGASDSELTLDGVYERYFDFVWRSIGRLGVDRSFLDDATHDVFLVLFRRRSEFAAKSSLKTWIFGIAYNVARDYRRRTTADRSAAHETERAGSAAANPEQQHESRERVRMLYELLDTLSENHRTVFVLAELEGLAAPEIAEALNTNLNTVYSRLRAARSHFEVARSRQAARARKW